MRIEILGESRVMDGDIRQPLPGGLPGRLLQCLILSPNRSVRRSDLAAVLWPDADLEEGSRRLRVTTSRLRKALTTGAEVTPTDPGRLEIETTPEGYRLVADLSSLDSIEFEDLSRQALEGDSSVVGRALRLWRGEPFSGFRASPEVRRQARRLEAVRARLEALTGDVSGCAEMTPSADLIERPRLMEAIRPGHGRRLIAVTAPAGYGKSTLLCQWLEAEEKPFVHLRLTEADNSPGAMSERLGRGLLAVAAHPDLADVWAEKMEGVAWQVNDVVNLAIDLETPINVALDDLHLVSSAAVVSDMRRLVQRSPSTVTLAVASRQQLPFPTGRLLAHREAVLFKASDLALTLEETGRLAETISSAPLEPSRLRILHELTRGSPDSVRREVESIRRVPDGELATWTPAPITSPLEAASPGPTPAARKTEATDPESIVQAIRTGNGTRLEEWIVSGSQLAPIHRESTDLIALGWALASSATAREQAPLFAGRLHPATRSTIRSLDLLRLGRWARAIAAAGAALPALEYGPMRSEMAQAIEWVVHQVRLECAIYTNRPVANREVSPPGVEPPWWWLLTRETGRRALFAALNGDSTMARESVRIVETAEVDHSWHLFDDGTTGTARLLVMANSAGHDLTLCAATGPVERADAVDHLPLAVLSRLGYEAVLRRSGDRHAAEVVLRETNEIIKGHPDLSALLRFREPKTTESRVELLPGLSELSHRERLVLRQLTTERTFAEIATELYLSPHTVRAHARSIYRKLGAKNRYQVSRALKDL